MISFFNQRISTFSSWFFLNKSVTMRRKLFNSLWAIFFGLVIALFFISWTGNNPFATLLGFFEGAQKSGSEFWMFFGIYAILSIAVGIGFKSGLFNIGVSGQMMLAGLVGVYFLLEKSSNGKNPLNGEDVFVSFLISLSLGSALAAISGILKAFLNVHEVVSTILMNWVIYYLGKYVYRSGTPYVNSSDSGSNNFNLDNISNGILDPNQFWIIALVIALFLGITIWLVFQKTTLGYKLKMASLNPNAAKYAGVSEKTVTIGVMSFSGMLAGLAGWIFYVIFNRSYNLGSGPIIEGFNGIAISLLVYNSSVGILLSSFIYAILKSGESFVQLQTGLENESISIISGIIIYFAALSVLFTNFRPLAYCYRHTLLAKNKTYWQKWYSYWKERLKLLSLFSKQFVIANYNYLVKKTPPIDFNNPILFKAKHSHWAQMKDLTQSKLRTKKRIQSQAIDYQIETVPHAKWIQTWINSWTIFKVGFLKRKVSNSIDFLAVKQMGLAQVNAYFVKKQQDNRQIKQWIHQLGKGVIKQTYNHYATEVHKLKQSYLFTKTELFTQANQKLQTQTANWMTKVNKLVFKKGGKA